MAATVSNAPVDGNCLTNHRWITAGLTSASTPYTVRAVSSILNPTPVSMDTTPPPPPSLTPEVPATEDKTVAILSYLTLIGFIVAIVLHGSKKTRLGTFHLRQSLGLLITAIACWVLNIILAFIPIIGWITIIIVWLGLFALWLMGLIAAASGQTKPVPVLGEHYQKWFGSTFE